MNCIILFKSKPPVPLWGTVTSCRLHVYVSSCLNVAIDVQTFGRCCLTDAALAVERIVSFVLLFVSKARTVAVVVILNFADICVVRIA